MGFFSSLSSIAGPAMTVGGIMTGNPALIAAGAGVGQAGANYENRKAADRQMGFQERMSNTAHQRQMKDLYNAGLNPILAAKYGGASTPGGSTYVAKSTADSAASSSLALRRQNADLDLVGAQTGHTQAQTYAVSEQANRDRATATNLQADTEKKQEEMKLIRKKVQTELGKQEQFASSAENLRSISAMNEQNVVRLMNEADIDRTAAGKALRWINRISESLQGSRNATGYQPARKYEKTIRRK